MKVSRRTVLKSVAATLAGITIGIQAMPADEQFVESRCDVDWIESLPPDVVISGETLVFRKPFRQRAQKIIGCVICCVGNGVAVIHDSESTGEATHLYFVSASENDPLVVNAPRRKLGVYNPTPKNDEQCDQLVMRLSRLDSKYGIDCHSWFRPAWPSNVGLMQ